MDLLESAKTITDMLKEKEAHEQIAILEIATRLLFEHHHVKLVLEPV